MNGPSIMLPIRGKPHIVRVSGIGDCLMPRLTGMDEAERQIRVARRLYEATGGKKTWDKLPGQSERTALTLEERRPFIDRACQGEHRDDDGYGV